MSEPIHVTAGFGWTAAGAWGAFLTLLGLIIRQVGPWRKQTSDAQDKLIETLGARVEKLENDLKDQQRHYEDRLEKMVTLYDQKVAKLQAENEASTRVARHELANAKMRFRALLMLLKRLPNPPDGLTAILNDIEAMEAEQTMAEAAEKGAQSGAKVAAAGAKV